MAALIEVVTDIGAAADVVFGLELDMDVHAASLAASGETATTSTGRRRVALGDEVTFRARHFGVVWRMTSRITAYEPPRRFVDEQVRGPFRTLHHELGPPGHLVLRPYLRRLLMRRSAHIKRLAEAPGG